MSDLKELLERVKAATGPSDELDDAIADTLGLWEVTMEAEDMHSQPHEVRRRDFYSDSIDAALALVEKMLPGWGWSVADYGHAGASCSCFLHPAPEQSSCLHDSGRTPPLAILAALLTAIVAQQ